VFLKNEDLEMLIELENVIFEIGIGRVKQKELEKTIAPHFYKLYDLIERLHKNRKITNEKNYKRITEKRKIDKNYARKKLDNGKYL
jgi:hypothetical protein